MSDIHTKVLAVIEQRLQGVENAIQSITVNHDELPIVRAWIHLRVAEMEADSIAAVLNQVAVLVVSKLNEIQEGTEWCTASEITLQPIVGRTMRMNIKFTIKGA